jgi:hypothetical protein
MTDDYLQAKIFQDRATPADWCVECEDEHGRMEVAIFGGPNARERAIRYADRHYGDFAEINSAGY